MHMYTKIQHFYSSLATQVFIIFLKYQMYVANIITTSTHSESTAGFYLGQNF